MKSFHNLKMIFIHMTSYWMQKSRKNFPKFTITMWYRGPTFFKCDAACPHHKPLCGQETISPFPNPIAIKFDGALYYHEGVDTPKKFCLLFWIMSKSPRVAYPSVQQLNRLKMWDLQFVVKNAKIKPGAFKVRITGSTKNDEHCLICAGSHLLSMGVPWVKMKNI